MARVTTKEVDVFLNPFQGELLVVQPRIRYAVFLDVGRGKKAEPGKL
jgi:hypothetical protein